MNEMAETCRAEYGKDSTLLKLSAKADWYVNRLDDFHIYEYRIYWNAYTCTHEYTYGWFDDESEPMPEERLNYELEELADELMEEMEDE